eukprot:gene10485-21867_t
MPAKKKNVKQITAEALIEQGNIALQRFEYELASNFFKRALEKKPEDTNIMDALADVFLQLGDRDSAYTLLQQSTLIAPEINPYKWLYLAQLQEGCDALCSYERAIPLLELLINKTMDESEKCTITKQLSKIHSSIAELYLTDLCFEDEAESKCETAVLHSLSIDSTSMDGLQALASLRLSQNRRPEACGILRVLARELKVIIEKVNSRTIMQDIGELPDEDVL